MKIPGVRTASRLLAVAILPLVAACSEPGPTASVPDEPPPAPAPQTQPAPRSTTVGRPASSTLGKAKQAAENVVDEAEQRQRDLQKQLEDPDG